MVSTSPLGVGDRPGAGLLDEPVRAFIQLSGLQAPPSAWMATQPSALTMISRVAGGRWAVSRPS